MKIFFLRHGESIDDIYDEFGGWVDRELSPDGVHLAFEMCDKLKEIESKLKFEFDFIYTSPLKRARQTTDIITSKLRLPSKELLYLKERNTYGLLNSVSKKQAKAKYAQLYKFYDQGKHIPGAERCSDFKTRITKLFDVLMKQKHQNILCVTHGYVISTILLEILNKDLYVNKRSSDGAILGLEVTDKSRKIIYKEKIEKLSTQNKRIQKIYEKYGT